MFHHLATCDRYGREGGTIVRAGPALRVGLFKVPSKGGVFPVETFHHPFILDLVTCGRHVQRKSSLMSSGHCAVKIGVGWGETDGSEL